MVIKDQINNDYKEFVRLKNYTTSKRSVGRKWEIDAKIFNKRMHTYSYDIRTTDTILQKNPRRSKYGVKMTKEEEKFYKNYCRGERKMVSANVCPSWLKTKTRAEMIKASLEKRRQLLLAMEKWSLNQKVNEAFSCVIQDDEDKDFEPPVKSIRVDEEYEIGSQLNTTITEKEKAYPKVQVRYSFKDFNENVIRVTTQIAADYILPMQTAIMVIRDVANGIFGQNYNVELDYKEKNTQSDDENDEIDDESVENATGKKSKRRMDYTYAMPSSRTVRRYLEDANLLNRKYLADRILSNLDEAVVTLGLDNPTKAAGNKVHDVQTTHFTFKGHESSRGCFTTGVHENASDGGKESAKQVTGIFSMMATLADCTVSEIKEAIDLFMVDRAVDANLMKKF